MDSPVKHNLHCFSALPADPVTVSKSLYPAATVQTVSHDLQRGKSKRPDSRLVMAVRQRKTMMGGRRRGCAVPCGSQPDAPSLSLMHMTAAQSRLEESSTPCLCSHTLVTLIQSVILCAAKISYPLSWLPSDADCLCLLNWRDKTKSTKCNLFLYDIL